MRFGVKLALKKFKENKVAEIDKLPGKLLKVNPERTIKELFVLFNEICEREVVPREWTLGAIVKVPRKGAIRTLEPLSIKRRDEQN